jgi:MYXO-CTERM domain-containing protein
VARRDFVTVGVDGLAALAPRSDIPDNQEIMGRREGTTGAFLVGTLAACALLLARPAWGQKVAFEAATSANGSGNSLSFMHTVGTGADRYLVLAVAMEPPNASVSSASFSGKALTRIGARAAAICRTELWGVTAPASGAQPMQINFSNGPSVVVAAVSSYTGVDSRNPTDPFASHTGTGGGPQDLSVSVAIDAGDFTVDVLCGASSGGAPSPKAGALQTQRWRRSSSTLLGVGSTQPNITSDGRATMSWTLDGPGTIDWSIATVPLNPAPAPPPPDAGPDLAPDVAPDVAPDLAGDLAPDVAPDLPAPEDVAEVEPDAGVADTGDAAPDVAAPEQDSEVVGPQMVDVNLRVGCACRTGGRAGGGALPLLLLATLWFRRRRSWTDRRR